MLEGRDPHRLLPTTPRLPLHTDHEPLRHTQDTRHQLHWIPNQSHAVVGVASVNHFQFVSVVQPEPMVLL